MGRAKRTRQYGAVKRLLNPNDDRLKLKAAAKADAAPIVHRASDATNVAADATVQRSEMFFSHNRALGPPFHVRFLLLFILPFSDGLRGPVAGLLCCEEVAHALLPWKAD